jgi:hypothetical protein
VNARDRLAGAGGWIRADGRAFADDIDQALANPWYPPSIDETGSTPPSVGLSSLHSFTATTATGVLDDSYGTCDDWTTTNGNVAWGVGEMGSSLWASNSDTNCDDDRLRLYCFGTDYNNPLQLRKETGRIAFLSAAPFLPGGGLIAADAQCQSEANSAGLTGTYLAFLATEAASASSRFDLTGEGWVRTDGARIVEDPNDISISQLIAPINIESDGTSHPSSSTRAWSGHSDPSGSGSGRTCVDWTGTTGQQGWYGSPHWTSSNNWVGAWYASCTETSYRIYCLQE